MDPRPRRGTGLRRCCRRCTIFPPDLRAPGWRAPARPRTIRPPMCGLSGWFDTRGTRPADKDVLRAMNDRIAHRGPDGDGFFFAPGVALAHRRLAIIDLSTGDQPMASASGRTEIVFNGEIYNFRELRAELEAKGRHFRTRSDTEVILQAWEEWGPDAVGRLKGM